MPAKKTPKVLSIEEKLKAPAASLRLCNLVSGGMPLKKAKALVAKSFKEERPEQRASQPDYEAQRGQAKKDKAEHLL